MKHKLVLCLLMLMLQLVATISVNAAPLQDFQSHIEKWHQNNKTVTGINQTFSNLIKSLNENPTQRLSNENLQLIRKSIELEAEWRSIKLEYSSLIDELNSKLELTNEEQDLLDYFEIYDLNMQIMINNRRELITLAVKAQNVIEQIMNNLTPSLNQGWNFSADLGYSNRDIDITETDRFLTLYQRYVNDKKRMQLNFTETIRWQNSFINNTQLFGSYQGTFGWKNGAKLETKLSNLHYQDKNNDQSSYIDTDLFLSYSTPFAKKGYLITSYNNSNKDFEKLSVYSYNYKEYYLYLTNELTPLLGYRYSFTGRAYDYPSSNLNNTSTNNFAALDLNVPRFGRLNFEYNNNNKSYTDLPDYGFVEQSYITRWTVNNFGDWLFIGNLGVVDSRQRGNDKLSYYQKDFNFRVFKPLSKQLSTDCYTYLRAKDYTGDNPNSFDQQDYNLTLNWTPNSQYFLSSNYYQSNYDFNDIRLSFNQNTYRLSGYYYLNNGDTLSADASQTKTAYTINDGRNYTNSSFNLNYLKFFNQNYCRLFLGYNKLEQDLPNSPNDYVQFRWGGELSYRLNLKQKLIINIERNNYDFKYNRNYKDNIFQVLLNVNF